MSIDADEDGDVPAMTDGIAEADAPDVATVDHDDDDEMGGADAVIRRRDRVISQKTRDLLKAAAQSTKKQLVEEADEFAGDDEPEPVTAAAVVASEQPKPEVVPAPTPITPLQPDPAIEQQRQRLDLLHTQLTEREQKLIERERATSQDFDAYRDAYFDKGAGTATVQFLRKMLGASDTDDITEEVADLITDLSGSVLKVPLTRDVLDRLESKRALKYVKQSKKQQDERERQFDEKRKAAEETAQKTRAIQTLGEEIKKDTYAKQFKHLSRADNAGALVFDLIEMEHRKDGTMLQWTEAAQRVETYLAKKAREFIDKHRDLLDAAPDKAPTKPANEIVPQGDPSGIRRSHTITNAASAATATAKPKPVTPTVDANGKWDREAHRRSTMQKMRSAFKEQPPDK